MNFEIESERSEQDNLEEMLQDLAFSDDLNNYCFTKKDNTIFVVDCGSLSFQPFEGQATSEFEKILNSYENFMMAKIINGSTDKTGLIFYNVKTKKNSLNFDNIYTFHELDRPSAKTIKEIKEIIPSFKSKIGLADVSVSLHHLLWLYGHQIKDLENSKNHLRLFLFTSNDCPHPQGDQRREQAINHARQLANKNVEIQLFPIKREKKFIFDLRKFYQEVLSFEKDDLCSTTVDSSSKILNLQSRIRQKQFKKRTLNRLLMKIGDETTIGIKLYSLYCKARKPQCKKLEASSNKVLKRIVRKINLKGEELFSEQIGSFYPLGGQKIPLTKEQMAKIKGLEEPGITLIGFKPEKYIKPYHNLRPSYFLYPDEEHVGGSNQFFQALLCELDEKKLIGIVKIIPRKNQQLRFAALFPQQEQYDVEDHYQTPPGFNMIILPYSDDIISYNTQKTKKKPEKISKELIQMTRLLINNLTIPDFSFNYFSNPSIQKFYNHLQAHALNQQVVNKVEQDNLKPDSEGLERNKDVVQLVKETALMEVEESGEKKKVSQSQSKKIRKQKGQKGEKQQKQQKPPKQQKAQKRGKQVKSKENDGLKKLSKVRGEVKDEKKEKKGVTKKDKNPLKTKVQNQICDGDVSTISVEELKNYLTELDLKAEGKKQELVDRVMLFISHSVNI